MSIVQKDNLIADPKTMKLLSEAEKVEAEIASKSDAVSERLFNEFEDAFKGVHALSDDYRGQELRFVHSFATMRDEGYTHLKALRAECATLRGKKHE